MSQTQQWKIYPEQKQLSEKIAEYFKCSPIIGQLLLNRSIENIQQATSFINKSWDLWPTLPNQETFIKKLTPLIKNKAAICVLAIMMLMA